MGGPFKKLAEEYQDKMTFAKCLVGSRDSQEVMAAALCGAGKGGSMYMPLYVIIKPNETTPVLVTANNKAPRLTGSSEIKEFIDRSGVITGEDPKPSSIDKYVPVPIGGGCSKIAVAVI